jgi:subtilase family serine protease
MTIIRHAAAALLILIATAAIWGAAAEPRVTTPVDDARRVTLAGNTRPEIATAADLGTVPDDMPFAHILLQLQRAPAEERAAEAALAGLQNPASPDYHRWLGAAQFGARFGADPADLAAVEAWLAGQGMTVNSVSAGRMVIDFAGTAGQVAHAFRTEIHAYDVGGRHHIANNRDPSIPAALAPIVAGPIALHDFRAGDNSVKPRFTTSCGAATCEPVAPGDVQTIYNVTPLLGASVAGAGQTIAVLENSDLFSNDDFASFRHAFGLDAAFPHGNLVVAHPQPASGATNCVDPGATGNEVEATLDVEWSSALAPDATIVLAACAGLDLADGVVMAGVNLVNSAAPPTVISISYGVCEVENGAAGNAALNALYQQAVAEGISVFTSAGDFGARECGFVSGIDVLGWTATQYDVSVGGTDFSDTFSGTNAQYWAPTNNADFASARSYVPEMAWNDYCSSPVLAEFVTGSPLTYGTAGFCNSGGPVSTFGAAGGGPSRCFTGAPLVLELIGGTCSGYPKPSWQQGVLGNPADGVRDVPDVALFASAGTSWGHSFLLCISDPAVGGPCTADPADWPFRTGGTSAAAPMMAGIQALIDQKMGERQGNPNPAYYALAAQQYGTTGSPACDASLGAAIGSACVFHDVTFGGTALPCQPPLDCFRPSGAVGVMSLSEFVDAEAYPAHPGWDFATGLGSVNAANLAANWASVAPASGAAAQK